MAGLYKLPHIFVVENNRWAIGMNHNRATSTTVGDEEPYIYKKVVFLKHFSMYSALLFVDWGPL
jgi:TPP-dependent pyruvate/acetoin dehydrogenase alpha subunit